MSTDNYYLKEHIKRHINFYTSAAVAGRGKRLYENDKVFFDEYTEKNDSWKFTVLGSKKYQVLVKGVNSKNIQTSCTCPFDWGSICKHAVAALHFVSDNLGEQSALQYQKQSTVTSPANNGNRKNLGFEIPGYQHIDLDFVKRNTSARVLAQLMYQGSYISYNSVEITHDSVTFIANRADANVKFYLDEEGKVYVTSPQAVKSTKLTADEALCLTLIANSPMPNLLEEVFSGRALAAQKEKLTRFGLPENTSFNEYFTYIFTEQDGLMFYPSKKGVGLIPVTQNDDHYITDLLKKLNDNELFFNELPEKAEQRELGFVLKKGYRVYSSYEGGYNDFYEDDLNERYEIVPIVGKTRKNNPSALATHIKEYDEEMDERFIISKSENAEKLLRLIDEIDNSEGNDFQLMKKAFEYLRTEKFVYGLADNAYKIRKKDLIEITLSPEQADAVFEVSQKKEFLTLTLKIRIGDELRNRKKQRSEAAENFIFVTGKTYHFAKNEKVAQMIAEFPEQVKMVATHKDEFFKNVIEPVSKNFEVRFKNGAFKSETVELDFHKKQLFLSEQNEYVVFTPSVEYDHDVSAVLSTTGNILQKNGDEITEYKRNFELENDFLDSLAELHPDFESQKSRKLFYLHYSDFTKDMWFYKFFDQLQASNVEVFGLKDLKNFKYSPFKGKINTSVTSGQDWFEVDIAVRFGDNRVTLSDIKKAVINKQRYIQLNDGSVGILPSEWLHKLEKYFRNGEINKDKLDISKLRFSVVDELFDTIDDAGILQEIAEKRQRLKNFTNISETEVPKQIKAGLRHYQKEGLNWLNFLDEMQWGGILADDMGLGKTLQVLAFLQQQKNKNRGVNLIVVPTSLLFNWENELKKFAPKLKAFYYYGPDRQKSTGDFENYDLVFTTYGILLRDIEILGKFPFNYAVLDESQAIKNPVSHRYKAACLINARNKIALTGTPIENSTFDLFAQMSYANRGFFGGAQKFRENYSTPIDKDENEVIADELNKIINPFVLRRTKEMVASELPDKTENILYCEMENDQRRVYDAYRNEYRNRLLNKIEEEGIGKSKMMVLEALTRLRQICDSPVLLNSDEVTENQSVKIKEIIRHITDKTGKHKILIFSQFVKMLGLIQDELAKLNIEYEYLDGQSSSKQREQSVNNFQENENLRVFLISLKAGGTGLNLTAADYVYIVDPWWNPAVENQAIDRCHRIGQNKKVFAYRMICKNTVEEKIIALQNKKKKIAADIIQTDENILKKLNKNDINELFS
jgi:SNF2 family DNA or RNA helicase